MTDKLKELIESRIGDIDKKDYVALFLDTIQQDTMYINSNLTIELYDLLKHIDIKDTDIYISPSNNSEVCQSIQDILNRKHYSSITVLVGWMFVDEGYDKTYYDLLAMVKHNDKVFSRCASMTCGDNESYINEDQIFDAFVKSIISEVKGY